MKLLERFLNDTSGATAVEYGLIAGLIAVVCIVGMRAVGTSLSAKFNKVSGNLT